jgi:DNA polymerase-3 subunit beta
MIKIDKKTISNALQVASSIVKKNSMIPILGYIEISYKDSFMRLRASDSETQMEYKFKCEGDDEFSFCVPAHLFIQTVLKMGTDDIEMTHKVRENNSQYVMLKSGKGKFNIETCDSKDYIWKDISKANEIEISAESFLNTIKRASTAVDEKEIRVQLQAVYVSCKDYKMEVSGISQHIISRNYIDLDSEMGIKLVPVRFSRIIGALQFKGVSKVFSTDDNFGIYVEGFTITTSLIDAPPVSLDSVWDKPEKSITVNRLELDSAIKRISSFSNEQNHSIKLIVGNESITVVGENNDRGHNAQEDVNISNDGVEEMEIGLNFNFINSALSNIDSDYIDLFISQPNKPVYVSPCGANNNYQYWLLMTMNLKN